jgi:hypothetical protein
MTQIESVAFCPHCCNTAPQRLVHVEKYKTYAYHVDGRKTESDFPCAYFVAVCRTCREVLVYLAEGEIPDDEEFESASLQWPTLGVLGAEVPERVRRCYSEAAVVRRLSPSSFAVQIRRALEALCVDRSAKGRNLHEQPQSLAGRGELPSVLAEMTSVLRLLGNRGAHAMDDEVQPGHVDAIDDFFRAVIEYVYTGPDKVTKLNDSLAGRSSIFRGI